MRLISFHKTPSHPFSFAHGNGRALIIALFVLLLLQSCTSTPPFKTAGGGTLPDSIATMEYVELGGVKQFLLIRGENVRNPVLLFLHGGPGNPYSGFSHLFQKELEKHFVVVQWDQRGSGKSLTGVPGRSLVLDRYLDDTHELTLHLLKRFGRKKIFLVGHSWGSYLGIVTAHKYPELFHAYVGVGQQVNILKQETLSHRYALSEARKAGDTKAVQELEEIGEPPYRNTPEGIKVKYKWLVKYGGLIHGENSFDMMGRGMMESSEYSVWSMIRFMQGTSFSIKHMARNHGDDFWKLALVTDHPDLTSVKEMKVPVYFFCGRHDRVTPTELTEEYFKSLKAPRKEIVYFENSGHFPFLKETDRFSRVMIEKVLKENYPQP